MNEIELSILAHALMTQCPEEYTIIDNGRKSIMAYKLASDVAWLLDHLKKEWNIRQNVNIQRNEK